MRLGVASIQAANIFVFRSLRNIRDFRAPHFRFRLDTSRKS